MSRHDTAACHGVSHVTRLWHEMTLWSLQLEIQGQSKLGAAVYGWPHGKQETGLGPFGLIDMKIEVGDSNELWT